MKDQVIINKPQKKITADTVVSIILDMSGSMSGIAQATRDGLNTYLESLRADNKNTDEVLVSITVFDSILNAEGVQEGGGLWSCSQKPRINTLFNLVPLSDIPSITGEHYMPFGGTPLYDAIGEVINRTDEALKGVKGKPDVLLVIITDGENNTSEKFTDRDAKALVEEKQGEGWTPIFLGANQDAWAASGALGIASANTRSYVATNEGMEKEVFDTLGARTHAHRMAKGMVYSANVADAGSYSTKSFFAGEDDDVEGMVEEMTKGAVDIQATDDKTEETKGEKA